MLNVTSEIGRLRRVLVHEPGPEVDRMVPAMMEELLFDDILYGDRARNEHARFRRVLQLYGIEVLDAADLLAEVLEQEPARAWTIDGMLSDLPASLRGRLREQPAEKLAGLLISGLRKEENLPGIEVEDLYTIPPLPNYCFQRDTQIVLGSDLVYSAMAAPARHREALLARAIFRFHPDFAGTRVRFDPLGTDPRQMLAQQRPLLEGGDVLVLSPEVVAVGLSERTNRAAVRQLARALAAGKGKQPGPRWLVIVAIPRRRAYMHLDTIFTAVDRDCCLVFPPVILPGGIEEARVYRIDLHAADQSFASAPPLLETLAGLGLDLQPIPCGGDDLVTQQREQWTDGANSLAIAPGVITLFDRNTRTAEELARRGFRVVDSEDLLLGRAEVDVDEERRVCILLRSHEISRARGGPHCLTHPLVRDDLA